MNAVIARIFGFSSAAAFCCARTDWQLLAMVIISIASEQRRNRVILMEGRRIGRCSRRGTIHRARVAYKIRLNYEMGWMELDGKCRGGLQSALPRPASTQTPQCR